MEGGKSTRSEEEEEQGKENVEERHSEDEDEDEDEGNSFQLDVLPPPPSIHIREIITMGVEKAAECVYKFVFQITWTNSKLTNCKRTYEELFNFHCELLDIFPDEAGATGGARTIPLLPGKKHTWRIRKSSKDVASKKLAEGRQGEIAKYISHLVQLDPKISRSPFVLGFLRGDDMDGARKEQQSIVTRERSGTVGSAPLPSAAKDPSTVYSGFLTKQGAVAKSWKRRFCILHAKGKLMYYKPMNKHPDHQLPAGTIYFRDVEAVKDGKHTTISFPSQVDPSCCFVLVTQARSYSFIAQSAEEQSQWLTKIDDVIKNMPPGYKEEAHLHEGPVARVQKQLSQENPGRLNKRSSQSSITSTDSNGRLSPRVIPSMPGSPVPVKINTWAADPIVWEYAKDDEGKVYYINTETMETSWELPDGVKIAMGDQ